MLVRTKKHGCYQVVESPLWGTYFRPCSDPDGIDLTEKQLLSFELKEDFPRLPTTLFAQILALFGHNSIETQVVLVRHRDDLSIWDALIPRQENTFASVTADKSRLLSLSTGAEYKGIPDDWVECGSAHSHPNMGAFWSSTDDASELGSPGLHFTIGGSWGRYFTICTRVCLAGVPHVVRPEQVINSFFQPMKEEGNEHQVLCKKESLPQLVLQKLSEYVKHKTFSVPKFAKTKFPTTTNKTFTTSNTISNNFDFGMTLEEELEYLLRDYFLTGYSKKDLSEIVKKIEEQLYDF